MYALQKRRGSRSTSPLRPSAAELSELLQSDTLTGKGHEHVKFLLVFERSDKQNADSIFVFYAGEHRDVTEACKTRVKYLIETIRAGAISKVSVREIIEENEPDASITRRRKVRVTRMLTDNDVDREKIAFLK